MEHSHQGDCHTDHKEPGIDAVLYGSLCAIILMLAVPFLFASPPAWLTHLSHATHTLIASMWWGVLLGMLAVGILSQVPREAVMATLGRAHTKTGIVRAAFAGVLLDMCSHGILLVGSKLYERGASIGQLMAFLIASPWNSFSLLFIMVSLMGLGWTLTYLIASIAIAILSGLIFDSLVKRGVLPENPRINKDIPTADLWKSAQAQWKATPINAAFFKSIAMNGIMESRMILRWLLFGIVLGALAQTFITTETLQHYFGPTIFGLIVTIIAATIIEVCSEGALPLASDLFTRAHAPGNAFAFLMGGVSTDYTEILIIRETTGSWKVALFLPLVTLPQVVLLAWLFN